MGSDRVKHISERETQLPEAVIGQLLQIAEEHKEVVSLSVGEPDFDAPKPLVEYTRKIASRATHYSPTEGRKELREAICKKLKKDNRISCNPENIVVTCGSQQALFSALATTLDVTEEVIVPSPCYLAYIPQIELVHGVPVLYQTREEDNWDINPDALKKVIDKKKAEVLMINTPCNPTGNVISPLNNIISSFSVFISHRFSILIGYLQGFSSNQLRYSWSSKRYVVIYLDHGLCKFFRTASIPNSITAHSIAFRKCMKCNNIIFHAV